MHTDKKIERHIQNTVQPPASQRRSNASFTSQ